MGVCKWRRWSSQPCDFFTETDRLEDESAKRICVVKKASTDHLNSSETTLSAVNLLDAFFNSQLKQTDSVKSSYEQQFFFD